MSQKGANDILQSKMPSFIRLCLLLLIILFSQCYCDGRSVPSLRDRKKPPLVVPWRQYSEHRKQPIEALLSGLARASKQIGVHLSCAPGPFGGVSRILCLSGAAALYSYNRSEAAQRACYFWKKAGPIVAHYRFTQWWMKASKAPIEKRQVVYKSLHDRYCQPSLDIILDLKGLYVKIGQVMSSRTDFMPVQYIEKFSTVQDSIPQWPIEEAIAIVRDSLKSEKKLDYEEVFETIDPVAIGSASIGQVHKAVLKEKWVNADPQYTGGRDIAIKVMHPDAKKRFTCDFQVCRWLFRVAMPGWTVILDELERRLMTEFDYHNEASSLRTVRTNLMKSPYRKRVQVPQPMACLTCKHLLVMELLQGKKLVDAIEDKLSEVLGSNKEKAHELLVAKEKEVLFGENKSQGNENSLMEIFNLHGIGGVVRAMKGLSLYRKINKYVDLLVDVHGHQIFQDATFNGDPHAGNIMELSDGRLGLIDFGQTRTLSDKERLEIAQVVVDLGKDADSCTIAQSMRNAGFRTKLDGDEILAQYAALFFDSDHKSKEKGFSTPQHYFAALMETDPLIEVPDAAIMVGRVSILFRGAGSVLGLQVQTSHNWKRHANQALRDASRAF